MEARLGGSMRRAWPAAGAGPRPRTAASSSQRAGTLMAGGGEGAGHRSATGVSSS